MCISLATMNTPASGQLTSVTGHSIPATLLKAAWMAIALGIVMEAMILAVGAAFGSVPTVNAVIADSAQKVSWSVLVCGGLAIGTAAARASVRLMGILGAISAPLGFAVARATHKGMATAMGLAPAVGGPSPVALAIVKAIQYGLLGIMLATMLRRMGLSLKGHLLAGFSVGVVFGAVTLYLMVSAAQDAGQPLSMPQIIARAVNEIAFPVGCSLVLYALSRLGTVTLASSGGPPEG